MKLPVNPPVSPMLAKLTREMPTGGGWLYEPKWDGFRCIVFRDGDDLELGSRNEKPLMRYFPELAERAARAAPGRASCSTARSSSRPSTGSTSTCCRCASTRRRAASRSSPRRSPPSFVAFDLLAEGDDDLLEVPFGDRRTRLEKMLQKATRAAPPHAGDDRRRGRRAVVRAVRGRGPRRRRRQAARRPVPPRASARW